MLIVPVGVLFVRQYPLYQLELTVFLPHSLYSGVADRQAAELLPQPLLFLNRVIGWCQLFVISVLVSLRQEHQIRGQHGQWKETLPGERGTGRVVERLKLEASLCLWILVAALEGR